MKIILMSLMLFSALFSSDINKGVELMSTKQYNEAGEFFLDLYLKDDIESISYLGELNAYHYTDVKDHCNAATYFLFQGIKEGDCRSSLILSNMYKDSICLKNKDSAFKSDKYLNIYNKCIDSKLINNK